MNPKAVQHISECLIKPQRILQETRHPWYLTPWDLLMLSVHYIQKGLLFAKPTPYQEFNIMDLLEKLKHSIALTLVHFYPLSGRLATSKTEDPASYVVYVDCSNSPGARFVYATLDMTVSDILSPTYVPLVVQSFFDHDKALNHDGHVRSLVTIQVTELVDGVFIGCSMNHAMGDGASFWHFLNTLSEIFQAQGGDVQISRPPVLERWFPDGCGELLEHNLGWAAWIVHEAVVNQGDQEIRERLDSWIKSPSLYHIGQMFDPYSVMMGSSPRFNKYGCEFGMGKALTLRSGYAHKFSGKVSAYPGREGGGSVDLEVCLPPDSMIALESDEEFMDAMA
ncbi:hypothetical protein GH714_005117 [Hevea brasiliensis]|uniref:Acetyltransferase n=1 Tax=Hevea brasiliensis TaxID=3981 RepID=A0A6A6M7W5_HEVBR|nr:hypothetical protein GH714_005117 [Hevea brasiliensis]